MSQAVDDPTHWEQIVNAVERVKDRLKRAAAALEAGGVPYAIVGGNAVASWVITVDPSAERFTQDVDLLLRRADLPAAEKALAEAGFVRRRVAGIEMFLDGPDARPRDAVHVVIAGEKIRPEYATAAPDSSQVIRRAGVCVLSLEMLVQMKLTSFRDKDRTHLRDMLDVGLIDGTWLSKLSPELAARLQLLIDTPEG